MIYAQLNESQRMRFQALVDALHDQDALRLVRWFDNDAPIIHKLLADTWRNRPLPTMYEEAFRPLMNVPALAGWVLEAHDIEEVRP